ncbi:lysozyme C-like [Platysternon megacephalum]|uniref:Lysozyme C-like n=1 Tax=Platysternon megacephalum TaxID=55544 RepID=A0A4D9EMB8_9SAUR|nr:lysozyme C-like [Platysternon megacephalum]
MAADNAGHWGRLESALRSSLRLLRDRWAQGPRQRGGQAAAAATERSSSGIEEAGEEVCALQTLPIDVQLYIISFLSPQDLCHLGSTNQYWSLTVRDPLLWRYFLLRDLPSWSSVDWKSLPDVEIFNKSFSELNDNALYDYMTIYKKSCPLSRHLKSSRPTYGAVTTFLVQSLVTQAEPRFALFGPGLEELDESLVRRMMTCPEILPVAGLPQRQIHGIGSGVSFQFNNRQNFNILTLYSTTSMERKRARTEQTVTVNKMFYQENNIGGNQQAVHYNVIAQVKKVCEVVDGFIYVANAEAHKKHDHQDEFARILAMIDPTLGPPNRPVLVLSCTSEVGIKRIPCVYMAHQLQLNLLSQPWMVQDTVAATLSGLLKGIEWILGEAECKNAQ